MATKIHPTAIVEPGAELADGVEVGPFVVIDGQAEIGRDCVIGPYSRITGSTTIGARNRFESHCSIGAPPQDISYAGEPTRLQIGDGNIFREFVTIHRGTAKGGGVTRIGHSSLFMAYVHVAHDCQVGSQTIFANAATLAGHVEVGDHATVGAMTAVHQFCRVGQYAFLGGFTTAVQDCLPYMNTTGSRPAKCYGPNVIGLKRKGFSEDSRAALKRLWRHLHNPKLNTTQALEKVRAELAGQPEVDIVLDFIETSKRGVVLA
ncbi:MAG TPA: acyl-ACP--UDP-N-acetylglucosamine O-acyltransferase [Methylomirabilota bacterium]|nr:acyl-ACP--UDP-N-acetylglucosamine O-acyltransferase [Methylomirabilota bacterium]